MENNDCIKKTYCLYASEWHLTIMLLPFISKKLFEKDRIYMKFENSIEDKMKQLVDKLDFRNKDELNNIQWNIEINDEDYTQNERIYIVAGSNEYMEDMNKKINLFYKNKESNVEIINCFDIEKIDKKSELLRDESYINILTTKGETLISSQ